MQIHLHCNFFCHFTTRCNCGIESVLVVLVFDCFFFFIFYDRLNKNYHVKGVLRHSCNVTKKIHLNFEVLSSSFYPLYLLCFSTPLHFQGRYCTIYYLTLVLLKSISIITYSSLHTTLVLSILPLSAIELLLESIMFFFSQPGNHKDVFPEHLPSHWWSSQLKHSL